MTTLREAAQQALGVMRRVVPLAEWDKAVSDLRAALAQPEPEPETCTWRDNMDAIYETGCGNLHIINDGSPAENRMKYCCYCGKEIEDESTT